MLKEIDISVVIPAYNEEKRLPVFLERLVSYCNTSDKTYEIIVVDDASRDKTAETALFYKNYFPDIELIQIKENKGKGYAVKRGLLKSRGRVSVFLDADGSVDPEEIEKNLHYIQDGYDIFVGSRVMSSDRQVLRVKWYRKFIGMVFNFLVQGMLFKNIKDTQCGFKMFAKDAVGPLFSRNYLNRFGFDVEILYLAHKMGYRVKEGPISWRHVGGSKVNLITDSISMFMNILQVRNWHCTPINPSDKNIGPDVYKYMHDLESYHWWFVSRNYLAAHLINSFHMPTPHILDIGCGAGASLASFMKLGEAYGIDISQKAVDFCHKQGFINVSLSAPENICFNDKRFDIIACLYLLARAVNPIDALLDIRRALKDSGKVIIMVPAFRMLWSRHDNALGHLRRYEKKQLIHDLNEAGLKIDKIGYFFFLSFFLVAPIRIMRKFFSANKKNKSDTSTLPPKIINEFLKLLFKMEIAFSDIFSLPFGTTLYAIASKNFS